MIVTFAHLISMVSALPIDASALESAISALVKEITTLESRSEFWEKSLPWFTGLVVLGLVADVVVIIWERRDDIAAYRRWVYQGFHPAERPSRWKFALELVASTAILLGVAGELWAGAAIAFVNGQLRNKNAELRDKSNQLVALLQKETEGERSARVKLEALVAWRRLSKEQQSVIAAHLKQFGGIRVGISYLGGNPEASQFAYDIAAALHAAQWNKYPLEPFSLFGGYGGGVYPLHPSTGVNVSTTRERGRNASEALQRELCSMGFDTAVTPKPPVTKSDGTEPTVDVVVLVVARPIASQGAAAFTINTKTRTCTSRQ
jgi:hypothetical protein